MEVYAVQAKRYRKKPVVIEALQFLDTAERIVELSRFITDQDVVVSYRCPEHPRLILKTLEGQMEASVGDYIIRGIKGEYYPCKPDIFHATYEAVDK